jgi:hypothetical protein
MAKADVISGATGTTGAAGTKTIEALIGNRDKLYI